MALCLSCHLFLLVVVIFSTLFCLETWQKGRKREYLKIKRAHPSQGCNKAPNPIQNIRKVSDSYWEQKNEVKMALASIEESFYIMHPCKQGDIWLMGIVVVSIDKVLQPNEIGWAILLSIGINQIDVGVVNPLWYFIEICKKSKARVKVIFEVGRRISQDALIEIINTARQISCDEGIAVCLINISSGLLVLVGDIHIFLLLITSCPQSIFTCVCLIKKKDIVRWCP